MPDNTEPVVIKKSPIDFLHKRLYLIVPILVFIIIGIILANIAYRSSVDKKSPSKTPTPSPTPVFSKSHKLNNISGLIKAVDIKNNSITIDQDIKSNTFYLDQYTLISQIDFSSQKVAPDMKVVSIPTQKITIKDIKLGQNVILVFDKNGTKVLQVQIYKYTK